MTLGLVQSAAFMAFASYGASGFTASPDTLTAYLTTFLNGGTIEGTDSSYPGFFKTYNPDTDNDWPLINGDWKVVWGPVVVTPTGDTDEAANSMYVAYSALTKAYVVAIAGTDYASLYDWKAEDLEVGPPMCSWPIGSTGSAEMISQATQNAMNHLTAMTAGGQTLQDFLASDQVTPAGHTLIFTGHSLAGALAPTLAYALFPSAAAKAAWGDVVYLALAGPTAGNTAFADAVNALFAQVGTGETSYPYWNTDYHNVHDMVPRAWNDLASLTPTFDWRRPKALWSIWGYLSPGVAGTVSGLVTAAQNVIGTLVYRPVNAAIVRPAMGSYTVSQAGPWKTVWQPLTLPTYAEPLSDITAMGPLIEAAHHDEYLNYFGIIPLQPLDVPSQSGVTVTGPSAAKRNLLLALADLHAATLAPPGAGEP